LRVGHEGCVGESLIMYRIKIKLKEEKKVYLKLNIYRISTSTCQKMKKA